MEGPNEKTVEVLDRDFTTFEGGTVTEMLNGEADKAVKERSAGNLQGAIERLERARKYAAIRVQSLLETAEKNPGQKDAFVRQIGEIERVDTALELILREFKG